VDPPWRDLLTQRLYQVASGDEGGNEANPRRGDPVFKWGLECAPLDPDTDLASASRLGHAATRKDIDRLAIEGIRGAKRLLGNVSSKPVQARV
jgi:hypothetical protein